MGRALWAVFGALILGLGVSTPVAAQEIWDDYSGASDSTRLPQVVPVRAAPDPCGPVVHDDSLGEGLRRRLIVTTAYCATLGRAPDAEGFTYWTNLLAGGFSPYELMLTLVASPEHQARGTRSFSQSLAAITLSPRRQAELEQRRQAAADAAEQQRVADEQARLTAEQQRLASDQQASAEAARRAEEERQQAHEQQLADERRRQDRLRIRSEINRTAFQDAVAAVQLGDQRSVTDNLIYGRLDGNGQRITVAYIHMSQTRGVRVSPGNRGRSRVGTWAAEIGADVAINGNWYSPYDGPAVSNGSVYGGADHFYTAMFGFTADGDAIIEHHRAVNDRVDERVVEAVSGHPTLIYRGARTTDFGGDPTFVNRNPRTAIGLDDSGDILILVTVDGRSTSARGMTGDETARLMERLGAYDAVMLDGGGSTTMWVAGQGIVNRPSGSPRSVGNQLAVFGD